MKEVLFIKKANSPNTLMYLRLLDETVRMVVNQRYTTLRDDVQVYKNNSQYFIKLNLSCKICKNTNN